MLAVRYTIPLSPGDVPGNCGMQEIAGGIWHSLGDIPGNRGGHMAQFGDVPENCGALIIQDSVLKHYVIVTALRKHSSFEWVMNACVQSSVGPAVWKHGAHTNPESLLCPDESSYPSAGGTSGDTGGEVIRTPCLTRPASHSVDVAQSQS